MYNEPPLRRFPCGLQGCLAAFFAKEEVTWACPAEAKLASAAKSGNDLSQELASPSMDLSTPDARDRLKRRRCAAALGDTTESFTSCMHCRKVQGHMPICLKRMWIMPSVAEVCNG